MKSSPCGMSQCWRWHFLISWPNPVTHYLDELHPTSYCVYHTVASFSWVFRINTPSAQSHFGIFPSTVANMAIDGVPKEMTAVQVLEVSHLFPVIMNHITDDIAVQQALHNSQSAYATGAQTT